MPSLHRVSGVELIKVLRELGFIPIKEKGSHLLLKKYSKQNGMIGCVVPLHDELAIRTLKSIIVKHAESTM